LFYSVLFLMRRPRGAHLKPSEGLEALLQAQGAYLQDGAAMPAMTRKRYLLGGKTDPCCPWPLVYPELGAPGSRLDRP
jgi:hypothetical protein